ncbi:MAG: hypothetical protein M1820_010658 [Bogoriella megaspora]|nr:MAG: hypothetical protein M1820_010658 [Bogoriella megaspora]
MRERDDEELGSDMKRRKTRKGTRSCWECKRRKIRCIFTLPTDSSCSYCRRRGGKCVSQQYSEQVSTALKRSLDIGDRMTRVESLIEDLARRVGGADVQELEGSVIASPGPQTDFAEDTPPYGRGSARRHRVRSGAGSRAQAGPHYGLQSGLQSDQQLSVQSVPPSRLLSHQQSTLDPSSEGISKLETLSRELHRSLPSQKDLETICQARSHDSVLFSEMLTTPYSTIDQHNPRSAHDLLHIPPPKEHPVLIARYMLQVATLLQHLHKVENLSEPRRVIAKKLAEKAISLVTTNDELLGFLECLECVMLESWYYTHSASLRRGWLANRRAMLIAQLMGLDRSGGRVQVLDPDTKSDPHVMWFRIVYFDRHLCLLLGLPQGSGDRNMTFDTLTNNNSPIGRLERIHCNVASRILERNASDPSSYETTRKIDAELQNAARDLPGKWWLVPKLENTDPKTIFWELRRLFEQLFHFNLLNQLHLPYMFRPGKHNNDYSKLTCVNASREMLHRFIALRGFKRVAYSCRTADFLGLMGAMTLLLAHVCYRRCLTEDENPLAHQYLSDCAMIEQVADQMREEPNSDALGVQSADLLSKLLAIATEVDSGRGRCANTVLVQPAEEGVETGLTSQYNDGVVRVHIPYFGIIKIANDGVMSKQTSKAGQNGALLADAGCSDTVSLDDPYTKTSFRSFGSAIPAQNPNGLVTGSSNFQPQTVSLTPERYADTHTQLQGALPPTCNPVTDFTSQFQNTVFDNTLPYDYPGLTAGIDDWTFQGVDMAFFDNFWRSTRSDNAEWPTW